MSYTKTTWVNDQAPAINATNLNHIETGIFDNDSMLTSILTTLGINTTTWVSTDTYVEGQSVVYNNKLYKNISGNYTTYAPDEDTTNWMETTMLDIQYPVGKTEIFYDNLDHTKYLGFTWERTAVGRAIVGYDSTQTEFDSIGETGGSKTDDLSNAYAKVGRSSNDYSNIAYKSKSGASGSFDRTTANVGGITGGTTPITDATELGGSVSRLQPYQVFAIWKRTS